MERHVHAEGVAPLHERALRLLGGAAIGAEVRRRQVGRLVAAARRDRGFAQALEVEQEELAEGVAAARELVEVAADVVGDPEAVGIVRRAVAEAAPVVALGEVVGGPVLDLGGRHAEIQARIIGEVEAAAHLGLLDFRLHVAVAEGRAGHHHLVGPDRGHARRQQHRQHREVAAEVHVGDAAREGGRPDHVVGSVRAVRARLRAGAVVVELEVERVGHFPGHVEAQRLVLVARRVERAGHRQVAPARFEAGRADVGRVARRPLLGGRVEAARVLGVAGGGRDRAVGPRGFRGRLVEPGGQLVPARLDLVLGVGVVERRGDPVGRRPLQGGLAVGALALHAVDPVDQVLRDRIDVARAGRVGRVGGRFRVRQRARSAREGVPATAHRGVVVAEVALLVAAAQGDAELAVGEGVAEDARDLAGEVVALQRIREIAGGGVVDARDADVGEEARVVERPRGLDVDRRADAAGGRRRAAGLVDLDCGDRFGRQVGEIERARVGGVGGLDARGRHLAAVEQHQVEVGADAAHGDLRAFAHRAVDRHAADALQRFGQVGVGELADVLGDDAVDDALRIALEVHRRDEAAADAGDHHGVERLGIDIRCRCRLLGCLVLRILGVLCRDLGGNRRGCQGQQQCGAQQPAPWNRTHLLHGISLPGTSRNVWPAWATDALQPACRGIKTQIDSVVNRRTSLPEILNWMLRCSESGGTAWPRKQGMFSSPGLLRRDNSCHAARPVPEFDFEWQRPCVRAPRSQRNATAARASHPLPLSPRSVSCSRVRQGSAPR